jgi:ElaB/YqjD/DUF883 family membrane-anchored ribosome-binding protein
MKTTQALSGAALNASTLGVDTSELRRHVSPQVDTPARTANYIRDNPWYAAVAAIGAGIVIGLLLPKK